MKRLLLPFPVLLTAVVSVLLAILLAFDIVPFLRGGEVFRWQWPYSPAAIGRVLMLVIGAVVYLVGVYLLLRQTISARWMVLWALMGATILPVLVILLRHDQPLTELFYRTASMTTTGPHAAGALIDWTSTAWHDWTSVMVDFRDLSVHVALSPPGLPMFYGGLNAIFENLPGISEPLHHALLGYQCQNTTLLTYTSAEWASAWFGMLMPLWAALAVFPLSAIAHAIIGEGARGVIAAWALIPALLMFAPSWNTFYPLLALTAFWLLLQGLSARHGAFWLIGSGFVAGVLTFANFSTVPLAGLFGFYVLLHYLFNQRYSASILSPVRIGLWVAVGFFGLWLGYGLFSGLTPLDLLQVAFDKHLELDRPYLPWLWMHFWEWALLTGIPVIGLWLYGAFQPPSTHNRNVLPLALLVTMVILLLSNTARGETARVWLFFAPFVLLSAGLVLKALSANASLRRMWMTILITQALLMLALASTWDVIAAPDMRPHPEAPAPIANAIPQNARFGDQFRLVGWQAEANTEGIWLYLNWQAGSQMLVPYYFGVLAVGPDGTPVGETIVWQPDATRYPTTCWIPGTITGDAILIPLPEDAPAGEWWLSLTAFADVNHPLETLPVTHADGSSDRQIGLGPVQIAPIEGR